MESLLFIGIWLVRKVAEAIVRMRDQRRIRWMVRERGGSANKVLWLCFGTEEQSRGQDRLYSVEYVDAQGVPRLARCRARAHEGIEFLEDEQVAAENARLERLNFLKIENRWLREEVARAEWLLERKKRLKGA